MNKNQPQSQTNKEKGNVKQDAGKASGDKSREQQQAGKPGAVLGEVNDGAKKKAK